MAGRNPRIQISRDDELDRAIRQARGLLGQRTPSSRVVYELAIRGAAALERERAADQRAREFLVSVADGTSGLDLDRLRDVRDRAWR